MPFAVKCGLARVTCFVGSPACASGFVTAQEIVSANKPGDDGAVILTRPPSDESVLHHVSRFFELEPDDVIATGTPAGVGLGHKPNPIFLKPGNVFELAVEKLGTQRQLILAWDQ
jgi:hypothetical protein